MAVYWPSSSVFFLLFVSVNKNAKKTKLIKHTVILTEQA